MEYPILEKEYPVHVYETGPGNNLSLLNSELEGEKALSRNAIKLEPAAVNGTSKYPFHVTISDPDINMHTNMSRYLKWVTDNSDLCRIRINWKKNHI